MVLNFYISLMRKWEWRTENLAKRVLEKLTNNVVGKSDERMQSVLQLNVEIMKVPNNKLHFPLKELRQNLQVHRKKPVLDVPVCYFPKKVSGRPHYSHT